MDYECLIEEMGVYVQEKCKPTPCKTVRRRSRMSEAMPRGLPTMAEEPTARKVFAQLCSTENPCGSQDMQDMETGASYSSDDEECSQVGTFVLLLVCRSPALQASRQTCVQPLSGP